jgi:hypothetical protein
MKSFIELLEKYNCDKGRKHHYHLAYEPTIEKKRLDPINFLEIGVYKSESTQALLEYFPNATIYGLDLFDDMNPNFPMAALPCNGDPRIKWHKGDSTSISLEDTEWGDIKFDYILDDGAHWPKAQKDTFLNWFKHLTEDGIYWIEDVWPLDIMTEAQFNHPKVKDWLVGWRDNKTKYTKELHQELVDVINEHNVKSIDHRSRTGQGDSFIYEITAK